MARNPPTRRSAGKPIWYMLWKTFFYILDHLYSKIFFYHQTVIHGA